MIVDRQKQYQPLADNDESVNETLLRNDKASFFRALYSLLKKHVTVPATFGYTRSQNIWWCTIPTRIQSLAIATFVFLNILACSVGYTLFAGNL